MLTFYLEQKYRVSIRQLNINYDENNIRLNRYTEGKKHKKSI